MVNIETMFAENNNIEPTDEEIVYMIWVSDFTFFCHFYYQIFGLFSLVFLSTTPHKNLVFLLGFSTSILPFRRTFFQRFYRLFFVIHIVGCSVFWLYFLSFYRLFFDIFIAQFHCPRRQVIGTKSYLVGHFFTPIISAAKCRVFWFNVFYSNFRFYTAHAKL